MEDITGIELDLEDPDEVTARLGAIGRIIGATVRNTANVTMLDAGYKANVIPDVATAVVDGRFLPGAREQYLEKITELIGDDIRIEVIENARAVETTFDGLLVDGMAAALRAEDPSAVPVPYLMSGGTDAKAFDRLNIRCFGFSPSSCRPISTSSGCSMRSTNAFPFVPSVRCPGSRQVPSRRLGRSDKKFRRRLDEQSDVGRPVQR